MEKSIVRSKPDYAVKMTKYLATLKGRQGYLKVGVAENLWRAMEEANISQAELARRAGVSPQYITKIFKGTTNFTLDTLVALFFHVGQEFDYQVKPLAYRPKEHESDSVEAVAAPKPTEL